MSVYVLAANVKKRLNLDASLYTLLTLLSLTLFEKMPLAQAIPGSGYEILEGDQCKQRLGALVCVGSHLPFECWSDSQSSLLHALAPCTGR